MVEKKKKYITHKELKDILHYDPIIGDFHWTQKRGFNINPGKKAGGLDARGYWCIRISGVGYKAHRLAFLYMTGKFPSEGVDHINHIKTDNSFKNLREANELVNGKNQKLHSTNTSGFTGVHWCNRENKWIASIRVDNKQIWLGAFRSFPDAVQKRVDANKFYNFHENHGVSFG